MAYNSVNNIFPNYSKTVNFSGVTSNPINAANNNMPALDSACQQSELINSAGNQAFVSIGQAQIAQNGLPKYETTPEQYMADLVKQGQVPNKNFTVEKSTRPDNRYGYVVINELNGNGKQTRETVFITDTPDNPKYNVGFVRLYNTETGLPYKRMAYSDKKDGTYIVDNFNAQTGEELSSVLHAKDGSIIESKDCRQKQKA